MKTKLCVLYVWVVVFFLAVLAARGDVICTNGTAGTVRIKAVLSATAWSNANGSPYVLAKVLAGTGQTDDTFRFGAPAPASAGCDGCLAQGQSGTYETGWHTLSGVGGQQVTLWWFWRLHSSFGPTTIERQVITVPTNNQVDVTVRLSIVGGVFSAATATRTTPDSEFSGVCVSLCTAGTYSNSVEKTGWIMGNADAYTQTRFVRDWYTRLECINGAWTAVTNSVWQIPAPGKEAWYILTACADGTWQSRQPIVGRQVQGDQLAFVLGYPVETNAKSCGQIAAESSGLVWSNLPAEVQAGFNLGIPGASLATMAINPSQGVSNQFWTFMAELGSVYTNAIPMLGATSSGLVSFASVTTNNHPSLIQASGTGQSRTGPVVNVVAPGGAVNIANLADLSASVSQALAGVYGSPSGTGTNDSSAEEFLSGVATGMPPPSASNAAFFASVRALVSTNRFKSEMKGLDPLMSPGSVSNLVFANFQLNGQTAVVGVDLNQNASLRGALSFLRACFLIGETILVWWVAMKIVRQGVA